jgi:hypothetical protein
MVEVFKTNVKDPAQAKLLIDQIHATFMGYTANFDLEDCDKILRVESSTGAVGAWQLVHLLKRSGFDAEVLSDNIPVDEIFQL